MKEEEPAEQRFARMTREGRLAYMESLVAPMRKYLAERENQGVSETEVVEVEAAADEGRWRRMPQQR
jgi:hypothetical protein